VGLLLARSVGAKRVDDVFFFCYKDKRIQACQASLSKYEVNSKLVIESYELLYTGQTKTQLVSNNTMVMTSTD
jgi:hypothetical protein